MEAPPTVQLLNANRPTVIPEQQMHSLPVRATRPRSSDRGGLLDAHGRVVEFWTEMIRMSWRGAAVVVGQLELQAAEQDLDPRGSARRNAHRKKRSVIPTSIGPRIVRDQAMYPNRVGIRIP